MGKCGRLERHTVWVGVGEATEVRSECSNLVWCWDVLTSDKRNSRDCATEGGTKEDRELHSSATRGINAD